MNVDSSFTICTALSKTEAPSSTSRGVSSCSNTPGTEMVTVRTFDRRNFSWENEDPLAEFKDLRLKDDGEASALLATEEFGHKNKVSKAR